MDREEKRYGVYDEEELIDSFETKEEALDFAEELSYEKAKEEYLENVVGVDNDEIDDDKLAEWNSYRGTISVREISDSNEDDE